MRAEATKSDIVNILLVDDQPAKLLSYEVILRELGENLLKASSAQEAFEQLLKNEIAVLLVDVCMPELDGFQLAQMVREHPRFQKTSIIFISAIQIADADRLRGYEVGAVDYVPVPVVPEVLRAKVRVFAELYRKTRQLEQLNQELERRVSERTADLQQSTEKLRQSEQRRSLALAAGQMGSWDWDVARNEGAVDEGQCRIFGLDPHTFKPALHTVKPLIHPDDWPRLMEAAQEMLEDGQAKQIEFRVCRPNKDLRWCIGSAAATLDEAGRVERISGVTLDITERKHAEERQLLLAREVDHRAKNALSVVQSVMRLTRAETMDDYVEAIEGRVRALASAHKLLSQSRWEGADLHTLIEEELGPYRSAGINDIVASGTAVLLPAGTAQTLALALHELATNAAKYGALAVEDGQVEVSWHLQSGELAIDWVENGGPKVVPPRSSGFGTKVITTSVEGQLGGSIAFEWRTDGLRCAMKFPIAYHAREYPPERFGANDAAAPMPSVANARRVLLLEDEALVALMVEEFLQDLGLTVIGPFNTVKAAHTALEQEDIDCAILDVNLRGEVSYPLAEILSERGIPFVFLSGYDSQGIDPRFAHCTVLRKPIDRRALERVFENAAPIAAKARDARLSRHA